MRCVLRISRIALLQSPVMAASRGMETEGSNAVLSAQELDKDNVSMFPGFKDADAFVKHGLGTVVSVTKASSNLPQSGDEYDLYRSFPGFRSFCEAQGDRLLQCMSQLMRHHGCRPLTRDQNRLTGLEESFDLVVDSNDVILERVGILLDEASGLNRSQQPVMPVGFQPPKTVVSSWNRKGRDPARKSASETFRLLQAKNIPRPQLKFQEKVDNNNTPFVSKIFIKPNAMKPLPSYFSNKRSRKERPEDLDIPAALADFVHQQRTQEHMDDMFAHPYQHELDHLSMPESFVSKPEPQMFKPISETSCKFIDTLEDLVALNERLAKTSEFAVDLEHHSYRSFLGLTCLMQISTRDEDYIIDTLELRSEMYILNETFTDPSIVKVFHGADSDVEWLQRDFGLYVVQLFDTHQAARAASLGRHSLDHLLKTYCDVSSDKRYQLADWRIRPLPVEMFQYARADTHYLLYIYDRMRADLFEAANGQHSLVQSVWLRSRDLSLKVYVKPLFTEHSYMEVYRKQKRTFNTQQLTAFRLLYAWRDRLGRQEDESTGYILPTHMMIKISEELPKMPQGVAACCNPVPPLVLQQINELHLLVQQARDMPLLKAEVLAEKKKGFTPKRKAEVSLFGPHDASRVSESGVPESLSPGVEEKRGVLFSEDDNTGDTEAISHLSASAKITLFADPDSHKEGGDSFTVAQQKACRIMESFQNPFRMYLPSKDNNIHISKTAKYDPTSKVYEISNRWKLQSMEQQKKEAEAQREARVRAKEAARKAAEEKQKVEQDYQASLKDVKTVRQQAQMAANQGAKKREGDRDDLPEKPPKAKKKAAKPAPPDSAPPVGTFKPYDYSQAQLKVFSGGKTKEGTQFDPNRHAEGPGRKKTSKSQKIKPSAGNKSMSYLSGKSERGFRHNWPKR
uniref:Exosome complex component 10 n=1 Tax=Paramormyrops kingsleyae TaxID=1676925 RepID=A0A3B3SSP7_9TELE